MKTLQLLAILLLLSSCIPLSIAPKIETDKVKLGRKFKRSLPEKYTFIFEDPKNANEFYDFVDAKYDLKNDLVDSNVHFEVDSIAYAFSFYEIEKVDRTINLVPLVIDASLSANDNEPIMEELYTSRNGHWYIAITVINQELMDCLSPSYVHRDAVVRYLRALREEYLTTSDYKIAFLRNQLLEP